MSVHAPEPSRQITITYFSDVLCVWAYIAQPRIDEVSANFANAVRFEQRFCNVFGSASRKIAAAWGAAHGFERFNAHLCEAVAPFPELKISRDVWLKTRPKSSAGAHLYLKAVQLAYPGCDASVATQATRAMRRAFFEHGEDISRVEVQRRVCAECGVDAGKAESLIADGDAYAALMADYQDAEGMKVIGSPTFLLNEGRQKLYGNVGYRIIEANILELLREPATGQASWC